MATSLFEQAKRAGNYALNPIGGVADAVRPLASGLNGGAATGVFPQMPTGGTAAPQPLAAQAQVRAMDNNPANSAAIAAAPLASMATPAMPPAVPGPSLASRAMGGLPAGVTRDGNSFSGTNVGAPPGAPAGGDSSRPYALGSMGDTNYQLANIQKNAFQPPAGGGLSIIDSTGDRELRNMAVSANSLVNRITDRRGNSVTDQGAPAVMAYKNALASRAQMAQTGAEEAGQTQRTEITQRGLAAQALMRDQREAAGQTIDQQRLGATLQHYQSQDANEKAKIAVEAGKAAATINKEATQQAKDTQDIFSILEQAQPLLSQATNSYAGAAADQAARAVGYATDGAKAGAQLKALEGALVSKMPKMSGPQSDKDVLLYKQMAGQIGDPTIPREQRAAAMQTIRTLNEKYLPAPSDPAGFAALPSGAAFRAPDGSIRRKP